MDPPKRPLTCRHTHTTGVPAARVFNAMGAGGEGSEDIWGECSVSDHILKALHKPGDTSLVSFLMFGVWRWPEA